MMAAATLPDAPAGPHLPVLIAPLIQAVAPVRGDWMDATFGAGGYTRALLEAGADRVIGIDRDPEAEAHADRLAQDFPGRVRLVRAPFSRLAEAAPQPLAGVVFDLGVSSMQLDQAERGFSFLRDGPLDMRMSQSGISAGDIVNTAREDALADILFHYGEERAARRIARAIVTRRGDSPITRTGDLASVIAGCLPRPKPNQSHPATRSFQALRIAVNDEFGEIAAGLEAAERVLRAGGWLAVVSFHSLEDRIVKRFLQARSGGGGGGSRHAPERAATAPAFELPRRSGWTADAAELAANPRARSARLRIGQRTDAPAGAAPRAELGLPPPVEEFLR